MGECVCGGEGGEEEREVGREVAWRGVAWRVTGTRLHDCGNEERLNIFGQPHIVPCSIRFHE